MEQFTPTVEWMERTYYRLNDELFDGKLGMCDFKIDNSNGQWNVLGYFMLQNKISCNKKTRRLGFKKDDNSYGGIDYCNFVYVCKPLIALNGNFSGSEYDTTCTLIHEMCHYYNYMNGYAPTRAHGKEFKNACLLVSKKSGEKYPYNKVFNSEESSLRLTDDARSVKKLQDDKKRERFIKTIKVLIIFRGSETIMLTSSSQKVIDEYIELWFNNMKTHDVYILLEDERFNGVIYDLRYRTNVRSVSFFNVTKDKDVMEMVYNIKDYNVIDYKDKRDNTKEVISEDEIRIRNIIREVIEEYIGDEMIDIPNGYNLGKQTPLDLL